MSFRIKNKYCWLLIPVLVLFACKNEQTTEDLNPIKTSEVSEFIRNPVTYGQKVDSNSVAIMTFEETTYNFGEVKQGEIVEHSFKFRNTGKAPLLISNVRSTCGCTVPKWPEDPVAPGGSGEISVVFKSENRLNFQEKPVIIYANTLPNKTTLKLKGNIIKAN